ncbi:MucB/RseB C-terminal domain-containing protein [Dokdonella soli]|uniref:Sigma factor AlgU regulator MucB n=2 Tax=Dokdonella soli TaxID=529810 RepID=A0ABN1IDL5_9GAMM
MAPLPASQSNTRKRRHNGFWRRSGIFFTALLALLQASPLLAEPGDAQDLLTRMSKAVRELDYQGSFVYEHDGRIDALRIFHAGGANERERLLSLSGPRSEIVRSGSSITCLRNGAPAVLLPNRIGARLLPLIPDTRGHSFGNLYLLDVGGEDRVAGYRARIVDVAPRDNYRYGYRLWLEEATHLPLRSAIVDSAKRTLEQFMFVALDVGAAPKESDLTPGSATDVTASPAEAPLGRAPLWRVAELPPGFVFAGAQRPAQEPNQAEHLMYTDGLADVSVYVEPRDGNTPSAADRMLKRGVLGIYSHDTGAWKITVLGDVPRVTLERMARSVQAVAAP